MAALIKQELALETELVEGGRGEFTVWVGEARVAQKGSHGFPADPDIVAAVKKATQATR